MPKSTASNGQMRIAIDQAIMAKIDEIRPQYMDRTTFINFQLDQSIDKKQNFPPNTPKSETGFKKFLEETQAVSTSKAVTSNACALPVEEKISPRQAGTNPRLNGFIKDLPEELKPHSDLIRDFWRVKKGSKGDRAWSLLQTGLKAIQAADGDDAVKQQLELAINAKWASITFANYEQFKPKPKAWEKEPETKHPAYKVFKASDLGSEWDIPSATGGKGVLDPGALDQAEAEACPF